MTEGTRVMFTEGSREGKFGTVMRVNEHKVLFVRVDGEEGSLIATVAKRIKEIE